MKRILFFALILMACITTAFAQKKQINDARAIIKSGKDFDKAEKMMTDLLNDEGNRNNEKIYVTLFEALKKQYEQGNEKLYLKQKYDTAALFNITKKMFTVLQTLDSVEMKNSKNQKKLKYRKKHAEFLNPYRLNLFSGGSYFARKGDFRTAFQFYDMYLDCARQPLFEDYRYKDNDKYMPSAAYWALYSGFKADDSAMTLKYADLALKDNANQEYALQFLVETYSELKEKEKCLEILKKGFEKYPESPYFFTRLADYYNEELHDYGKALTLADKALANKEGSTLFLFAKSTALLNLGKYTECIEVSKKVIDRDDTLKDAYLNVGLSYFNLALTAKGKIESLTQYEHSMKYMEKYRELAPDDIERWGSVLYNIYLNLNMGEKFNEIDKLMKKAG